MADVVLLSTADWDHPLWTNKQHQALSLAGLGHRVLYVDSLGVRAPRPDRSDSRRIWRRLRRGLRGPRQVSANLWVVSPLVIPGQTRGFWGLVNRRSLALSLLVSDWLLDFRRPLLWTFNPQTRCYLKLKKFHSTIYHCVDRIQAQPGMPVTAIETAEVDLCGAVNAIFTTSPELQRSLSPRNAGTHYFGNVADAEHFAQALNPSLATPSDCPKRLFDQPLLMFIGAIDAYKLHLHLLEVLAKRHPRWTFCLIGPVGEADPTTDVSALARLSNVHLLGPRPYQDLPAYLSQADVALLPLQLNDYTRNMYPMKFFEYLAAGCSVVATDIPSLRDQADVALLCPPEIDAFESAIERVLSGDSPLQSRRLERASCHTYRRRTQAMLELLGRHGLLPDEPLPPQAPPYHQLRAQCRWSWLWGQWTLFIVRSFERVGATGSAEGWLRRVLRAHPSNIVLLGGLTQRRLQAGDYVEGCRLIERIWLEDGEAELLHQLLFRRGSRPGSRIDQLTLFDALAASAVLPFRYTGYCRVVRTYRAIDAKDEVALRQGVEGLSDLLCQLQQDPDTYRCLKPNRENRAKLLISAQLTRLRALMALNDTRGLDKASLDLIDSTQRYDPFAIDRKTALRMTRNILRSLTVAAVMAWHAKDAERYDRVISEVSRLRDACFHKRFEPIIHSTQEDHRAFADALLTFLSDARWPKDAPEQRPELEQLVDPVLLVYFPDLRRQRAEKARSFLQSLDPTAES